MNGVKGGASLLFMSFLFFGCLHRTADDSLQSLRPLTFKAKAQMSPNVMEYVDVRIPARSVIEEFELAVTKGMTDALGNGARHVHGEAEDENSASIGATSGSSLSAVGLGGMGDQVNRGDLQLSRVFGVSDIEATASVSGTVPSFQHSQVPGVSHSGVSQTSFVPPVITPVPAVALNITP